MRLVRLYFAALSVFLLSTAASGNGREAVAIQKTRSYSVLVATHALIYYGAERRTADPRNLYAYQDAIKNLEHLVSAQTGLDEFKLPVSRMKSSLQQLEETKRDDQARYPELLVELLDSDAAIRALAEQRFARAGGSESVVLLRELSQGIGDLLIGNQARITRVVGEYSLAYDASAASIVDKKVNDNFDNLIALMPDHSEFLIEQRKRYRFVRGQFISNDYKNVTGSAAFYLEKVILDLDSLAESVAQ